MDIDGRHDFLLPFSRPASAISALAERLRLSSLDADGKALPLGSFSSNTMIASDAYKVSSGAFHEDICRNDLVWKNTFSHLKNTSDSYSTHDKCKVVSKRHLARPIPLRQQRCLSFIEKSSSNINCVFRFDERDINSSTKLPQTVNNSFIHDLFELKRPSAFTPTHSSGTLSRADDKVCCQKAANHKSMSDFSATPDCHSEEYDRGSLSCIPSFTSLVTADSFVRPPSTVISTTKEFHTSFSKTYQPVFSSHMTSRPSVYANSVSNLSHVDTDMRQCSRSFSAGGALKRPHECILESCGSSSKLCDFHCSRCFVSDDENISSSHSYVLNVPTACSSSSPNSLCLACLDERENAYSSAVSHSNLLATDHSADEKVLPELQSDTHLQSNTCCHFERTFQRCVELHHHCNSKKGLFDASTIDAAHSSFCSGKVGKRSSSLESNEFSPSCDRNVSRTSATDGFFQELDLLQIELD